MWLKAFVNIAIFALIAMLSYELLYLFDRYFNKIKCEEIAKILKLSNRTYFRRLEKAEVNFINLLKNYKILI